MGKPSAGILLYRQNGAQPEIVLAHPGGPYFRTKDEGYWTIPKGEVSDGEELEQAARRELKEEIGVDITGLLLPLGSIKQKSGKIVHAFGAKAPPGWDPSREIVSNMVTIEWPPKSGTMQPFPEIDRAEFFVPEEARIKIMEAQLPLVDRLLAALARSG